MKLSQVAYQTDKPAEVEITDHKGKSFDPPAFISVMAFNSKEGKKVQSEMYRDIIKLREDSNNINEDGSIKLEVIDALNAKTLTKLTTSWRGIEDDKNKPIEFSQEKCEEIYTTYPFIFERVNVFCSDLGKYLAK